MLLTIIIIVDALALGFFFAMRGRTDHPGVEILSRYSYAHRGLHSEGIPENSLPAFQAAAERGFGSELDVHLLADGNLAVIHDSDLERVTGLEGRIEDLTAEDLQRCRLMGTEYTVPLLSQVLEIYDGKAPLIVEIKVVDNNTDAICRALAEQLDGYSGSVAIESFHPAAVAWFRKNRPELLRGQLSENYSVVADCKLPKLVQFGMRYLVTNIWTKPDFVAYNTRDVEELAVSACRNLWKMPVVVWTVKTKRSYDARKYDNFIIIFEDFIP